ncbi:MAG: Gfo/Idh/MocA family protein, partial [Flavobacteriales bacterium]
DFEEAEKTSNENHVHLLVAENYYYKPLLKKLRSILALNLIGDVLFVHVNATKTQENNDWRDDPQKSGGGALIEGGIHWVDFMVNMGLKVNNVTGYKAGKNKSHEQSMDLVFEYEEGAIGNLLYSWEVNTIMKGLRISRIYGKEGSITFESNGVFLFVRGKRKKLILPGFSDIAGYNAMFDDFLNALSNGKEPEYDMERAKLDLWCVVKAYE